MAVDRDGVKLEAGDRVWIEAVVLTVYGDRRDGNLDMRAVAVAGPDQDYLPLICLNSRLVRRVLQAPVPVGEPVLRPPGLAVSVAGIPTEVEAVPGLSRSPGD